MPDGDVAIVLAFEDPQRERFVLARHPERGWEIPGGWVEAGETPDQAARREFAEEIGHELVDLEPVLVQERASAPVCHVFAARLGEPVEAGEDVIEDWRFVERLADVEPLAFPDDPYEEIEAELGVDLGAPSGS